MSLIREEMNISKNFEKNSKYPIHIGPVFTCAFCRTNFINLLFLWKHFNKCITNSVNTFDNIQFKSHKIKIVNPPQVNLKINKASTEKEQEKKSPKTLSLKERNAALKLQTLAQINGKPLQCHICKKIFGRNYNLQTHLRTHTGEKPFQCDVCQKQFAQLSTLKKHRRIHSGEKPYPCDICNKQFPDKAYLKIHLRFHTGEKPYECEVCSKKFAQISHFRKHQRIHAGIKPYQCDVCKKKFSDPSNFKKHVQIHPRDNNT